MAERTTKRHLQVLALEVAYELGHLFYSDDRDFQDWVSTHGSLRDAFTGDREEARGLSAYVLEHHGGGYGWQLGVLTPSGTVRTFGRSMSPRELYETLNTMRDVLERGPRGPQRTIT